MSDSQDLSAFEPVIGLEVHIQLNTRSKAYSADPAGYGERPNSMVGPISLGHPGTLPVVNRAVVESAIRLGLACGCTLRERNEYARKNYFYADLPKGYQITQHTTPICTGGSIGLGAKHGGKRIALTRIHMEEDAGKSLHDLDPFHTLVDLNRAGVPLLEMVSEPEFTSGEEAYAYLTEVRRLVRYLDISDGNMEEGSLRCDVNISVRPKGQSAFGTKVEVKNLNSFRHVQKAIEYEFERQVTLIQSGGAVQQQTRTWDSVQGMTQVLRSKEEAHDYRYFPEPDLPPVYVGPGWIEQVRTQMPALPEARIERYTVDWGLSPYDASVLVEDKAMADYFEHLVALHNRPKACANVLNTQIRAYLNQNGVELSEYPVVPERLAALLECIESGSLSHSAAFQKILPLMESGQTAHPLSIAEAEGLLQDRDEDRLRPIVLEVLEAYPAKVEEYLGGKKGLLGLFMGEVMKRSGGKADPQLSSRLVQEALEAQRKS
ncbi:Asp-tRNA(Asn)/Glu-tRNA(Gln) amidotransferase subunit GatB [bacterium]|nr:Asp-tRNA(Asn)/Glu-tRNA(Gln) amidotransferase subunit GatB [bacterium]